MEYIVCDYIAQAKSDIYQCTLSHHAKFCADRLNRSGDRTISRFVKMAAIRHVEFFKVRNFTCWYVSEAQCASVPNSVLLGQTVPNIWHLFDFPRWRPSAILDFSNFDILPAGPVRRRNMCRRVSALTLWRCAPISPFWIFAAFVVRRTLPMSTLQSVLNCEKFLTLMSHTHTTVQTETFSVNV